MYSKSAVNKQFYKHAGLLFSKPIIKSDSKYALISYSTFTVGGNTGGINETILLKNINGKWKIMKAYVDPNVIN
jgi:hypothetical protein